MALIPLEGTSPELVRLLQIGLPGPVTPDSLGELCDLNLTTLGFPACGVYWSWQS